MKTGNKYSPGFTLIEILVVVSIIGFLTTIVLVSLNSAKERAKETAGIQQLGQVKNAINMFYTDNGYYPGGNIFDLETALSKGSKIYISEITPNPQLMYYTMFVDGDINNICQSWHKQCTKYVLLLWDLNDSGSGSMNWQEANDLCISKGERLPDKNELYEGISTNAANFQSYQTYWSRTREGDSAYYVGFDTEGNISFNNYSDINNKFVVHCVRE